MSPSRPPAPRNPPPSKRPLLRRAAPLALGAAALGGFFWWASRPLTPSSPPQPTTPASALLPHTADLPPTPSVTALPDAPSPIDPKAPLAAYAGQKKCAECHRDQHARWSKDWHARALSPANHNYIVGQYDNSHFKGGSSEAWMSHDKDKYSMRTAGVGGALATFLANWVIGGKRMQDALTALPDGRWQILPVYYHVTGKGEWVDYTETKQGALGPDHPFYWTNFRRTANHECLDCHTTGLEVRYDRKAHAWDTHMIDPGVACESCHGPGARHAETQDPADIIQLRKADPAVGLAICGQCHGPRRPLFAMLDAARHFVPGQRYEEHFQPHGLVSGKERSGDFFADGRPKSSSFEYQAIIQSRCHLEGKATCLSCHTAPHAKQHDEDEVKVPKDSSLKGPVRADASSCQGCHAPLFADKKAHSHHSSAAAQSCLACHMPKVVTGVLDTFADHAIDVPVPENTEKHDIPNACGQCHTDKTPAAMASTIASWWPSAKERQARRLRLADAFDDKTAAQSEQPLRAVIADTRESPFLRANSATLLAQRFPQKAEDALTPLLAAPDPLLRAKAAESLPISKTKNAGIALARLSRDPSIFVREAAAIALSELGDPNAEPALRALTSSPATEALPRPHALLGLHLARRGDIDGAITQAERAIELQPYYVDALIMLADLYARREQFDRTEAMLKESLSFDPQHPAARKRLRVLMTGK